MSVKQFKHHSKTKALSAHLIDMARDLGPGAKMPKIQELRRDLNVSVATLDSALAQLESQKVIQRKHGVGIFVSPHLHQKSIGLICEPAFFRAASPFWQRLIEDVQNRAVQSGDTFRFYLAIPSGREDVPVHDDLIEDVRAGRIHGAFFIGHNKPAVFWLKEQGVPSVAFAGWSECTVSLDYADLTLQAAQQLHKKGCTKIGVLVTGEIGIEPPEDALYSVPARTLRAWCARKKLDFWPSLIWEAHAQKSPVPHSHEEQGFFGTLALFKQKQKPDGLIVTDDLMTRGVLRALQKLKLRAGNDVQIVSHANRGSDVLQGCENILALVEFDPSEVVRALFEALELLMGNGSPPAQISIKPRIISQTKGLL